MKTAYELAMERLQKQSPVEKISGAAKGQLADIDNQYQAKIAEREVFLEGKIREARLTRDFEAVSALQRELAAERTKLAAEREAKKEDVRHKNKHRKKTT